MPGVITKILSLPWMVALLIILNPGSGSVVGQCFSRIDAADVTLFDINLNILYLWKL